MSNDRRKSIDEYIQAKGEVRLAELEERYPNVSSMTLRRDLEYLERMGKIIRIRGGAKSIAHLSMVKEAAYTQRMHENTEAKFTIAAKAVSLIQPDRSLYIDSGTTCMCLAQRMSNMNLYVLTPAPNIALELIRHPEIKVSLTGGQLNRETLTLSGFNATEFVKNLNIDQAFVAASAFSADSGFSCGDFYEAELKRLIIKKAREVIMMVDSSKINTNMPYTFARLQNVNTLICDEALPAAVAKLAQQSGVTIL